jgi:type III restriction enzyme
MSDQHQFRNEDLVLRVSRNVDPAQFDAGRYEAFIDALCETREYQKEAIRTVMRYFLGGRYTSLRDLAEENFGSSAALQDRYGTFHEMERNLQLPDRMACSVDLATATGKSYVMYGLARIMLAHGVIDRVLVLCPSRTIERGLSDKFRALSGDAALKALLPEDSRVRNPHIINGNESIVDGSICIENFHATLQHVRSSIRDTLAGRGVRVLVLNDEVHHVYNPTGKELKRWKEFLLDPEFGFKYIAGFSGTCYVDDDYFSDVVARYSLHQAIEQGYAKTIDYTVEDSSDSQDEKFQKIYDNHVQNRAYSYRKVKPLTILVTRDIPACRRLTTDLTEFLAKREDTTMDEAARKVLIVTSARDHEMNVQELSDVDRADNPREWITSVSMLTEGWDVQNVFQIVPHEERAFNSKLLIAQVLGRGLRVPAAYRGERPVVTVFNHDAWSSRIRHLVDEVMEYERRVFSYPVAKPASYDFTLHQIDYTKVQEVEEFPQTGEYEFTKGYIKLVSQVAAVERETVYVRATTGERREKKTLVRYQMFTVEEVVEQIHNRLQSIDLETENTNYADRYNPDWLRGVIRRSLELVGETGDRVSEENRQRLYRAFNVLHRGASKIVRYRMTPNVLTSVSTASRSRDSVGVSSLRRAETTIFWDERSLALSDETTQQVMQEILADESLPRSAWHEVDNAYLFKTPLNLVIADHRPERDFIRHLIKTENAACITAWLKSTDRDFYPIEYAWRKNDHPKRGYFNPDFFIRLSNHVLVVEIKSEDELADPADENRGKFRAARQHFATLNTQQAESIYHFHFLTPSDYDPFFQFVRDGNYSFVSKLDAALDDVSE